MVPMWMFPLALACGNTFVLKPSEKVPLTAILIIELLENRVHVAGWSRKPGGRRPGPGQGQGQGQQPGQAARAAMKP